jgi:L-asparaginase/Glu-tRNA(Gln) amidotransferase subunit D
MKFLISNLKSGADQKSITHFVTLGGTITSSQTNQGVRPTQNPEKVIKECLHPDEIKKIEIYKFKNTLSGFLNIKEFFEINRTLHEASQNPNTRAIIVLTGTDNLENIIFFVNLLTPADTQPIIFTGAMTPYGQWRSDVFKNINDAYYESYRLEKSAVKIAAVFGGETFSAVGVRKIDTDNPKAFIDTTKNLNPLSIHKIIEEKNYFINFPQIIRLLRPSITT